MQGQLQGCIVRGKDKFRRIDPGQVRGERLAGAVKKDRVCRAIDGVLLVDDCDRIGIRLAGGEGKNGREDEGSHRLLPGVRDALFWKASTEPRGAATL